MFAPTALAVTLINLVTAPYDNLTLHQIGGPQSLKWELVGPKSAMTDDALEREVFRACPKGYQSDAGVGISKPDGAKWWRFTFFCLDPSAEGSSEAPGHTRS